MTAPVMLSTLIDSNVKQAAAAFCKRRGLKLRYFVEKALVEQLEDELDLAAYEARRDEETIPFVFPRPTKRRGAAKQR